MNQRIILLVEDNADDEALTVRALKGNNIVNPVVVAHDGREALDYLFARGSYAGRNPLDIPAVMLLDLKLPKVDGLEVLRQVRADEVTRILPVVILTSSKEEQDLIKGYSLGCNSYICKPVDFEQFRSVVRTIRALLAGGESAASAGGRARSSPRGRRDDGLTGKVAKPREDFAAGGLVSRVSGSATRIPPARERSTALLAAEARLEAWSQLSSATK
jgi:CheY-like chemotaxis protein